MLRGKLWSYFLILSLVFIIFPSENVNQGNRSDQRVTVHQDTEIAIQHDLTYLHLKASEIKPLSGTYTIHDPIYIDGDTDFHSKASLEGWNVGGTRDGSVDKPYIISGYNITNSDSKAIEIRDTNLYFEIIDNAIIGADSDGIRLKNVVNAKIFNNTISNNTYGIEVWSSSNNIISGNTISNNTHDGIELWVSSNYNTISNNAISKNAQGIDLYSSSNYNTIHSNAISNNAYNGIKLGSSSNYNTIHSNTISNTTYDGILLGSSSKYNTINSNTIFNNSENGIRLSSDYNTIHSNIISNNSGDGIELRFSSNYNSIYNNTIFDNLWRGIVIYDSSNYNSIVKNTISNNIADGIGLWESSHNTISNNMISSNTDDSIQVSDLSSNNIISNNSILNNVGDGIYLSNSSNYNSIFSNTISNNSDSGIRLLSSSNNTLSSNIISNNSDFGTRLSSSTNNVISSNTFISNTMYGVLLTSLSNNTIIKWNNFVNNSGGGVQARDDGSNNEFNHNYWGDFTTPDNNSDSIVDDPYNIDGSSANQDLFPLTMKHNISKPIIITPIGGVYSLSMDLHWLKAEDNYNHSIHYTLYYSIDGSIWNVISEGLNSTNYTWDITSNVNGSNYKIIVEAIDSEGGVQYTISEDFTIEQFTPTVPQNLIVETIDANFMLTWSPPASNGSADVLGYYIYRGNTSDTFILLDFINETFYLDSNITKGQQYYYVVTAVNIIGESGYSNQQSIIILTEPDPPDNLILNYITGAILLTWDTPTDTGGTPIIEYDIYRGTTNGSSVFLDKTVETFYFDLTFAKGQMYFYKVVAINDIGQSNSSYEKTIIVITKPSPPENLVWSINAANSIFLTWNSPTDIGGTPIINYIIYRRNSNGTYISQESYNATFYIDNYISLTNPNYNDNYYYVVTAVNVVGESIYSNVVNIRINIEESTESADYTTLRVVLIIILLAIMGAAIKIIEDLFRSRDKNKGSSRFLGFYKRYKSRKLNKGILAYPHKIHNFSGPSGRKDSSINRFKSKIGQIRSSKSREAIVARRITHQVEITGNDDIDEILE